MSRTALSLLLLVLVAACSAPASSGTTAGPTRLTVNVDSLERYRSEDLGFAVSYPQGWSVNPDPDQQLVAFSAPAPDAGFTDNFNVSTGDVPDDLPAAAYYEGEVGRLRSLLSEVEILEMADVQIEEGVVGRGITLVADMEGARVGIARLLVLHDGQAWELSFFTAADRLDDLAPLATEIFRSFELVG